MFSMLCRFCFATVANPSRCTRCPALSTVLHPSRCSVHPNGLVTMWLLMFHCMCIVVAIFGTSLRHAIFQWASQFITKIGILCRGHLLIAAGQASPTSRCSTYWLPFALLRPLVISVHPSSLSARVMSKCTAHRSLDTPQMYLSGSSVVVPVFFKVVHLLDFVGTLLQDPFPVGLDALVDQRVVAL